MDEDLHFTQIKGSGARIDIAPEKQMKIPLHIIYASGAKGAECKIPKSVITLGKLSQAQIIESYFSLSDLAHVTLASTDIFLEDSAKLSHLKIQAENSSVSHESALRVFQKKDSEFSSFDFTLGGKEILHHLDVSLCSEGAWSSLDGLYAVQGDQHVSHDIVVDHIKPHTTSRQLYKGILDDEAKADFNGRVVVRGGAELSDSSQLNKNLLLSEKAHVETRPQLEIANPNVQCTHGATVGQIDPEQLFYFQSRGIPESQARNMLIRGFVDDVMDRVKSETLRSLLTDLLEERFFHVVA